MRRCLLMLCAGWTAVLPGCAGDMNARLEIGTRRTATFAADETGGMGADSERERAVWGVTREVVPIDGVIHGATLRGERRVGRRAERWEVNAYPETEQGRASGGDGPGELVSELGRSAFDVGLWAWRAAAEPGPGWSPRIIWKRQPAGRARVGTVGGSEEAHDERAE